MILFWEVGCFVMAMTYPTAGYGATPASRSFRGGFLSSSRSPRYAGEVTSGRWPCGLRESHGGISNMNIRSSVANVLLGRPTLPPEPFAVFPLPVFCCAFSLSTVERPGFASGAIRSTLKDDLTKSYVRGDIELERGCAGEGRASTSLPTNLSGRPGSRDLPASESGGELGKMPTELPPSGFGLA